MSAPMSPDRNPGWGVAEFHEGELTLVEFGYTKSEAQREAAMLTFAFGRTHLDLSPDEVRELRELAARTEETA